MTGTHGGEGPGRTRPVRRLTFGAIMAAGVVIALAGGSAAAAAGAPDSVGPAGAAAGGSTGAAAVGSTGAAVKQTDADVGIDLPATESGYAGAPIWLDVLVNNAGPATATNVVVTLDLPTGLTPVDPACTVTSTGSTCRFLSGSVPAGFGLARLVELRAAAAGSYSLSGQVTADQPDPVPANNVDTTVVSATELADVSINLPAVVSGNLGGMILLSVEVANAGPTAATGVQVTLEFPAGLSPIGLSCTPTDTGSICQYAGGTQPPNTGSIALIRLEATAAGSYTVRGQVSADQPDPVAANNADTAVVEVTSAADLAVQVAESADPTATGRPLTYTVTISNQGPSPASAVVLVNTWTATTQGGAELLSVQPSQGSCLSTAAQRIDCQLGSLASGASATVTVRLRPRGPGQVTDQASVSAAEPDPVSTNNTASETTVVG